MSRNLIVGAVCLVIAATTGARAQEVKSFTYKKTKDADLSLQAYFPSDWTADDQRPAIVFFFGGGWNGGTIKQFDSQATHLAKRGMVAFCADYRVKSRHGVTPVECVEDAKSAIRYIRQHAASLGIDPKRIVAAGGSAGGHIAACTGLCPGFDATGEDTEVSSRPNVLVLFNPVLNLNNARLIDRVGGDAQLAQAISPLTQVGKEAPPTLLFFGTADPLTSDGEAFVKRSTELGNKAELFLAPDMNHGFFNRSPWLEKTTARMDEFLRAQGYLQRAAEK